jgi:hypothetical protein
MMDEARDLTRGGGAGRIALSYLAFTGMVAAAALMMKLVVALQLLGSVKPGDF